MFVDLEHNATSYSRIHGLLIERRGPATCFSCACGKKAETWAYRGGSPDERLNGKGHPYSLNLLNYDPLCRSCHGKKDHRGGLRARLNAEPELRVRYREGAVRAAASRKKYRCGECSMETYAGAMTGHQRASGHTGRTTCL